MNRTLSLLAACLLAACGARAPAAASTGLTYSSTVNGDPRSRIEVRVDPDLEATLGGSTHVTVESDGGGTTGSSPPVGLRVEGEDVDLSGDELRVGGRSYGPLAPPYELHFRADGVYVDGVRREPLP